MFYFSLYFKKLKNEIHGPYHSWQMGKDDTVIYVYYLALILQSLLSFSYKGISTYKWSAANSCESVVWYL